MKQNGIICTFFENKSTFLFLYYIWLLLNLQMCQIILFDPVLYVSFWRAGPLLSMCQYDQIFGS